MKKTILFLALVLLMTGCLNKEKQESANNPEATAEQQQEQQQQAQKQEENSVNKAADLRTLQNHQDLFAQYDSAVIKTNYGSIKVKFYEESPITVNNFLNLARDGFYNKTKFHRVIKDFMIQGGDPNSKDNDWSDDGMGGPRYKFNDEINEHKLVRGSLAMANSGPNTNGSQFFIVTKEETSWLDGKHTNFGYVTDGMAVVEKIEAVDALVNDHPSEDIIIESIELIKR